ncbi:hypothetical protein D3C78_1824990 [compost metagenome]
MAMLRARNSRSSAAFSLAISLPFTVILPTLGSMRRLRRRINVDLPLPESPMMQKISPRRTWRLASETPTTQSKSSSTCFFDKPRSETALTAA